VKTVGDVCRVPALLNGAANGHWLQLIWYVCARVSGYRYTVLYGVRSARRST